MYVLQVGEHWVIARGGQASYGGGNTGSRSRQANRAAGSPEVWTGERWWGQRSAAQPFATRDEAQQYLEEHREQLQAV